jgi:sugar transferase (PEP-CTERM/EpsH1 system associated)
VSHTPEGVDTRPLIAHIVFSLDYGGLENGVINVVNGLDAESFRHAIISLTTVRDIRNRIRREDVQIHALEKRPGKDPATYLRLFGLLRHLRPSVVHSRNIGTIDSVPVARFAGVPCCIHGEHGWDVFDPGGTRRKYRAIRRLLSPAIARFVAVSAELERWLVATVGIPAGKVLRVCNGVDTERFRPPPSDARRRLLAERFPPDALVVGSVTRFGAIKDPLNLVRAFLEARTAPGGGRLRLVMIGDGTLRAEAQALLLEAGAAAAAWLPGSRDDIPELLREIDLFVLGSLREGISNTILEAMATGLPVIATATGGNGELILPEVSGLLVPPGNSMALAQAILRYAQEESLRRAHAEAARVRAVREFSLERMLTDYAALYAQCALGRRVAA